MIEDITIDKEFQSICRNLSAEEYQELLTSIAKEGFRDPLVVWLKSKKRILLDGHHRYSIWQTAFEDDPKTAPPDIIELELKDREEARRWIARNQLGRRNVTPQEASYLRGLLYNSQKQEKRGPGRGKKKDQNDPSFSAAAQVAKDTGVGEATVKRDGRFAQAVDAIGEAAGSEAKREILSGDAKVSRKQIEEIAGKPKKERKRAFEEAKSSGGNHRHNTQTEQKPVPISERIFELKDLVHKKARQWPQEDLSIMSQTLTSLSKEVMKYAG